MSRYLILLLLNIPFIVAGLINALIDYKLSKSTRRKFLLQTAIWLLVLAALSSAQFIYKFLFANNLTATEPLSLFDVIQITAIIIVFFIANRSRSRLSQLERRVQDLHQELSIQLANDHRNDRDK